MSGWLVFGLYAAFMVLLSLAFRRNRRVYREIQDELASIRRDVKLEGTEPLSPEEAAAIDHFLSDDHWKSTSCPRHSRAMCSHWAALEELRARLTREYG